MDNNIIALTEQIVKGFILADGVYPYDDPEDHFVVIIGDEEVAWAETKAEADRSFAELLHYDGEHFKHCPSDYQPNPLLGVCPTVKVRPFRLQQVKLLPVSQNSAGAHIAVLGAGYRRVEE